MSRARGPHSAKQTRPEVMSLRSTLPSSGRCRRSQAASCCPYGGPGDEQVAVGRHASDGHVALDPAAAVQQLRVHDPADRHVDVVARTSTGGTRPRPARRSRAWRTRSRRTGRPPVALPAPPRRSRATSARPPSREVAGPRRRRRRSTRTSSGAPSRTSRRRRARAPRGSRRSAPSAAGGRPGAPRSGSGCRSRSRSSRSTGPACTPGCDRPAPNRRMSIFQRSSSGSPSTIQDAIWRPIPPAPAMPWAENPAATKNPRTSDSPRMNSLSGVNASGPLMIRLTPASAIAGTRRTAPSMIGSKRGHVGCEQLAVEVGRDTVERPRRRIALVAAHAQAADLLAEVDEVVRVAELRQAGMDALDRLGEEVLVRHRDDRDGRRRPSGRSPGRTSRRR